MRKGWNGIQRVKEERKRSLNSRKKELKTEWKDLGTQEKARKERLLRVKWKEKKDGPLQG